MTLILLFAACDAVKKVGDNEHLLTKNILMLDGEEIRDPLVESQILQEPNSALAGLPIGLHVYNLANENPDSTHYQWVNKTPNRKKKLVAIFSQKQVDAIGNSRRGLSNWLKETGEAPVIIRNDRTERSRQRIQEYYKSLGWFNAEVDYTLIPNEKKEKRATITYNIKRNQGYIIDSIERKFDSPLIDSLYNRMRRGSSIRKGDRYNLSNFISERERVTFMLRNSGMYHFNQEYISFIIDTVNTEQKANVEYLITHNETEKDPFKIHTVSKINIITDYSYSNRNQSLKDSINYNGYTLYSYNDMDYKPKAITDAIFLEPGKVFRDIDRTLTYNHLSELRVFRYPNISFVEDPADSTKTNLIANILLTPRKKYAFGVDFDLSTSPIQEFGIGFNSSFLIRNIFKGAETLEFSARGSVGSSRDASVASSQFFNISEVGGDIKLNLPRILFPFNTESIIPKSMSPSTGISVGAGSQHNIGLDKQNINTILNYKWSPSRIHTYRLDLFNVQYVRNLNTSNYFNVYRNSFQRLNDIALSNNISPNISYFELDENNFPIGLQIPDGANAFLDDYRNGVFNELTREQSQILRNIDQQKDRLTENNLIFATNITWIRDSRRNTFDNQFSRIRLKLESAGTLLSGISQLTGMPKNASNNYEIFNVAFSQYIKFETEYVRYWALSRSTTLAMRLFGGIAIPYGNSNSIPFARSYFAGGPNDNRGWQPFRLGPGSSDFGDQFNEANMKRAANFEYRYTILGAFKGAFFVDVGNIWNALDNVTDEASVFNELDDLRNIAIASGFGLRYDFGFFVLRLDAGFKTYNPALPEGERWFKEYNFSNYVLNIGVNYPF
ncbi:MAG TPA: BamA/TamA family outer membrane protein [Flavobacteriaceae bacterium]|nr:BamA/TamA family outer membrane protein [Flavobacteriaceae bacterium]